MTRKLIVVDVETSALEPTHRHATAGLLSAGPVDIPYGVVTEAAWTNLDTGERRRFVAPHRRDWVRAYGEPAALVVSRYLERLSEAEQDDGTEVRALHAELSGNTLVGSNPSFDAKFLAALFSRFGLDPEPWHHRLGDLSAYAARHLDISLRELPGLSTVCERLGVEPGDHTAEGDVRATVECLLKLGVA